MSETYKLLAVDPGRVKCGLAVIISDGTVLAKTSVLFADVAAAAAELAVMHEAARIVIGSGTGSAEVIAKLQAEPALPRHIEKIGEKNTTLEARKLYEKDHPLPWPLKFFPRWLFGNPRALDAYAAIAIGMRYIETKK